jgi:hypothetical protein
MTGWRAAVVAAGLTWAHSAGAQPVQPAAPIFSADVLIEDAIVDAQGRIVEARPATRYRITRRPVTGGIETEIVYAAARLFTKGPLHDPRSGLRYVFGPPGSGVRVYDTHGQTVAAIADDSAMRTGADGDDATVVYADRELRSREAALRRRLGRPVARLGRHDRYVTTDGDSTSETLVEPATMLPVEANVVRGGALALRSAWRYGRMPGGRWYLATMRTETVLGDGSGRRFVSTETHTNVSGTEGR